MSSYGTNIVANVVCPLSPQVLSDETVVSKKVLEETIAEKISLFDEFDPITLPLASQNYPKFFQKFGKAIS